MRTARVSVTRCAGVCRFAGSAAGDLITFADVGKLCCIVDDQTVAGTDGPRL